MNAALLFGAMHSGSWPEETCRFVNYDRRDRGSAPRTGGRARVSQLVLHGQELRCWLK